MANTRRGRKFRRFLLNSSGNATIFVALAAVPMVACAGIAIDYLRGVRTYTELQQVADAGALAAASAKNVTGTTDQQKAKRAAIASSFINASLAKVSDAVMVGSPVVTAATDAIDVQLNAKVKGSLINVLNLASSSDAELGGGGGGGTQAGQTSSNDINLSVHSKVVFSNDGYLCVLALNPTASDAIYLHGTPDLDASGCAVQANSNATVALKSQGNSSAVAKSFCAAGGKSGSFSPTPTNCPSRSDPLASLVLPTDATTCDHTNKVVKKTTAALTPGTYCGGISVSTKGVANLSAGVYIIKNGNLDVDSQSTLNATTGVTFYLTGNSSISIQSGAVVTMKAPTTGTYQGMAIMQDRTTGIGNTNVIKSKGGVNIEGIIYTPQQKLSVEANDDMNTTSNYFAMIVDTLEMSGNATLTVKMQKDNNFAGFPEPTALKLNKIYLSQ